MVYENYDLGDSGIRHTFSVLKGLDKDRIGNLLAFAYNHGADDVRVKTVPESNGWQYELEFTAPKYDGQLIREQVIENGYASYATEIDPREQEITEKRLKEYIV